MKKNKICAVITAADKAGIEKAGETADLFEVRIDLIGSAWQEIAQRLTKPWIGTNRPVSQHGNWTGNEEKRTAELVKALELGAWMIDIELDSPGLQWIMQQAGSRKKCLVSYHDWQATPPMKKLAEIVNSEITSGAHACKVVTTARRFEDNMTVLKLFGMFPAERLVAFAMGADGVLSRVMAPLAGAYFTYASITDSSASAPGQISAKSMHEIYGLIK